MSRKITAYLGLGTNEGDREANMRTALSMLDSTEHIRVVQVSGIIETEPWGFDAEQKFLNCAARAEVDAECTPERLLDACKDIERKLGRDGRVESGADGKRIYRSRPMDIDILLYGNLRLSGGRLEIPHPLMRERAFVMVPLMEVADDDVRQAFPEIFGAWARPVLKTDAK